MPRTPRSQSPTGCHHVTLRGSGRRIIFETDDDRRTFLALAGRCFSEAGIGVVAWCLMDNHVHFLLHDGRFELSRAMQRLSSRYAVRFNRATGHFGHVFQARFGSRAVRDDAQLLATLRYIHENPEKAGMCASAEYPWSSHLDYAGERALAPLELECDMVLGLLGGREAYQRFCQARYVVPPALADVGRPSEQEAREVADTLLGPVELHEVATMDRPQRDASIRLLRSAGITCRQIERLTGVGRKTVARICADQVPKSL